MFQNKALQYPYSNISPKLGKSKISNWPILKVSRISATAGLYKIVNGSSPLRKECKIEIHIVIAILIPGLMHLKINLQVQKSELIYYSIFQSHIPGVSNSIIPIRYHQVMVYRIIKIVM